MSFNRTITYYVTLQPPGLGVWHISQLFVVNWFLKVQMEQFHSPVWAITELLPDPLLLLTTPPCFGVPHMLQAVLLELINVQIEQDHSVAFIFGLLWKKKKLFLAATSNFS